MAIKNIADRAIAENIRELVLNDESDSIFNKYRNKTEIGELIFKDLYSTYTEPKRIEGKKNNKGVGFCLTDKDIGLLSQCQSLQAMLLLASEFNLDFDTDYTPKGTGSTIRQIMDDVIDDLLSDKIKKEDGRFVFDASPYEEELFTAEYSNIDAIRWVVTTFLLVLKYHAEQHEICKWEDDLINIISYGMKYINEAFIGNYNLTEENTSEKLEIGWNFTKDCEEPSLFYTFAVCECYISFYRTFKDHLDYLYACRTAEETDNLIPIPERLALYEKNREEDEIKNSDKTKKRYKDEVNKLREIAQYDTPHDLCRIYKKINGILEGDPSRIENTVYGELELRCKAVSKEIWRLVKDGFADSFYYNDLHSKISQDDIKMSTTSDALFNSVYIINTIIDAGLDEDIMSNHTHAKALEENAQKKGEDAKVVDAFAEEAEKYLRDYNELLETCQLASQKALRSYEILKKEGKEYIVDQFLIGFNESFNTHKDLIKELRKRRMRVFSLLPMLIRTNNLISEYLVRYPQVSMSKYLGYILDNRRKGKGSKVFWMWEADGFFSASNYYYVAALGQFYAYHKEYEESYIDISDVNATKKQEIREEYKRELELDGEIAQLNTKLRDKTAEFEKSLADKDREIANLNAKIASHHSPIEDAVVSVVEDTIRKQLPMLFCDYLNSAAESYAKQELDRRQKGKPNYVTKDIDERNKVKSAEKLIEAFEKIFVAYLSKTIYAEIDVSDEKVDKQYKEKSEGILTETKTCLGGYAINIIHGKVPEADVLFPKGDSKEDK
ncbi:MAG: hypothetical protein J6S71_03355 [Clostridia bacterium]|nr:hypothetical protein [Clostridia bacterium]